MKQALGVGLGSLVVMAIFVAVLAWAPWSSGEREREQEWLQGYIAWNEEIDAAIEARAKSPALACERRLRELAGEAPPRLSGAMKVAVDGCRSLRRAIREGSVYLLDAARLDDWHALRQRVVGELVDTRAAIAKPAHVPLLADRAAPLSGRRALDVLCWLDADWQELNEDWARLRTDELWVAGFADIRRSDIHLAPQVCDPLRRFFAGNYAPNLNVESFELAEALVTLAHEAEHLRSPRAPEADVECVAIQRVRDLVRDAGRAAPYAELMAGLAWDVGYPEMPDDYRTDQCYDGSALDLRPETSVWP